MGGLAAIDLDTLYNRPMVADHIASRKWPIVHRQ